jgi:hypothetical protein
VGALGRERPPSRQSGLSISSAIAGRDTRERRTSSGQSLALVRILRYRPASVERMDIPMTMTNHTILAEAAAVATVSPWAWKPANGDRFGHVQALVGRCVR